MSMNVSRFMHKLTKRRWKRWQKEATGT